VGKKGNPVFAKAAVVGGEEEEENEERGGNKGRGSMIYPKKRARVFLRKENISAIREEKKRCCW